MEFNRDRNGGSGRGGGFRPRFNNRGSVEMHKAICDSCHIECEVPFRPTSGKPVFCSSCFGSKRNDSNSGRFSTKGGPASGWESRNSNRSTNFEERQTFSAVCADCNENCKVPFQPSNEKPVFCSNCFGDKKNSKNGCKCNAEEINAKLDKILSLLSPVIATPVIATGEIKETEIPVKAAKKKTSVKSPEAES